jgi:hypothetical protein
MKLDTGPASSVIAISADLAGSRKAKNRTQLAEKIEHVIAGLTEPFAAHWLAPPMLTRGLDELSAAMDSLLPVFDFGVALNEALWPHRFRFGVGVGLVDIGLETRVATRLDGTAFHLAAEALAEARRMHRPLIIKHPAADPVLVLSLEALAEAHAALVEGWTPAAARHVPLMRSFGHQVSVAATMGVSQQVVSRTLGRARYRTLCNIETAANQIIASRLVDDDKAPPDELQAPLTS